jgi:hypothetical protein
MSYSLLQSAKTQLSSLGEQIIALKELINQAEDPGYYYEELYGSLPDDLDDIPSFEPAEIRQWVNETINHANRIAVDAGLVADRVVEMENKGKEAERERSALIKTAQDLVSEILNSIEDPEERDAASEEIFSEYDWLI